MHAYTQAHCHGKHWSSSYLGISFTVLIIKNREDGTFEVFIVWHFRCFAQMDSKPVILSQLGIFFPLAHIRNSGWKIFNNFPCLKFSCRAMTARLWFGISLTKDTSSPLREAPMKGATWTKPFYCGSYLTGIWKVGWESGRGICVLFSLATRCSIYTARGGVCTA